MAIQLSIDELYRRWLRYPLWRLLNPAAPYEHFYADIVLRRLRRQGAHDAIGGAARPIRAATELLDVMAAHGMRTCHRFIDYGCGSLRLGRAVMEYLDPCRFAGMDVAGEFLDLGLQFIGAELVAAKRPRLHVISPAALREAAHWQPDYVGSWHVCSKVPWRELPRYFASIIGLMHENTQAFVQFPCADRRQRLNHLNWSLSPAELVSLVAGIDPAISIDFIPLAERNAAGIADSYARLSYRRRRAPRMPVGLS